MSSFVANILMGDCSLSRKILQPVLNFGLRFYVAFVFFKSGLGKVDDKFQVTDTTKDLFAENFQVPLLSSDVAAYLASYAELILPILLVLGILTRPAAFALFILNAVASYSLIVADWSSPAAQLYHVLWGTMLAVVFVYGPSKVSIDSWIASIFRGRDSSLLFKLVSIIVLSGIGYFLLNKYL
ncbi:MAG: DoxX family protein [Cocleimonas sp.]